MITMIDYDAGNLKSVEKALDFLGEEVTVSRDKDIILNSDKVILPGVGAYGDAMDKLKKYDLMTTISDVIQKGIPFLGICLGMQLLFEGSEEDGGVAGLGILKGGILKIPATCGLKVPHIGWNSIWIKENTRLFKGIPDDSYVYFVHSYYLKAADKACVAAITDYGVEIHAAIEQDNVFACQFHPEKSSDIGLHILKNFAGLV